MKHKLKLNLPISINKLYAWNPHIRQKVYKKEGKQYLETESLVIKSYMKEKGLKPFADYFHLDMDFVLKRSNTDSHNLIKLINDSLEWGGFVTDDRYIMNRIQSVRTDPKNPHVLLSFTT